MRLFLGALGVIIFVAGILFILQRDKINEITQEFTQHKPTNSKDCTSDPQPVFSVAPTDINSIDLLSPPIMQVGTGIKSHSYIATSRPVPVYAPVDSTLTRGAKYQEEYVDINQIQYTLFFEVSCEVAYYYDHLINPPEKIASQFPGQPQNHSRSDNSLSVKVKAGEIIGYTWAPNFDFGVLDYTKDPSLAQFEEYKHSEKAYAICPLLFFNSDLKYQLTQKIGYTNASDLVVVDNLCNDSLN